MKLAEKYAQQIRVETIETVQQDIMQSASTAVQSRSNSFTWWANTAFRIHSFDEIHQWLTEEGFIVNNLFDSDGKILFKIIF